MQKNCSADVNVQRVKSTSALEHERKKYAGADEIRTISKTVEDRFLLKVGTFLLNSRKEVPSPAANWRSTDSILQQN